MINISEITKNYTIDLQRFELLLNNIKTNYSDFPDKILKYILETNGKKIRPIFTYIAANLFGKTNERTDNAALIIELMHIASLLHDDVIDEAKIRRQRETVNYKWNNKTAILSGDFIFAMAMNFAIKNQEYKLFDIIAPSVMDLSMGEILEINFSKNFEINLEKYLEIIFLKTASLISCCFECGSFSVSATKDQIAKAKELGKIIGIMFQIKDDFLDYTNNRTGKEQGIDIKGNKITLPFILAYKNMDIENKKQIEIFWNKKNKTEKDILLNINRVIEFNGIVESEKFLQNYLLKAENLLNDFSNKEVVETLRLLLNFLISREY